MPCRSRQFTSPTHDVQWIIDNNLPMPPCDISEHFCRLEEGHDGWHDDGAASWPDRPVVIERWVDG